MWHSLCSIRVFRAASVIFWQWDQRYLKADTLVFTATMGGKTIATVEISLKDYSIVQCRAFANQVCEYTEQIAGIINANKKLIAERKRA